MEMIEDKKLLFIFLPHSLDEQTSVLINFQMLLFFGWQTARVWHQFLVLLPTWFLISLFCRLNQKNYVTNLLSFFNVKMYCLRKHSVKDISALQLDYGFKLSTNNENTLQMLPLYWKPSLTFHNRIGSDIVNGLNPGVSVDRIVWSSRWEYFWKELFMLFDDWCFDNFSGSHPQSWLWRWILQWSLKRQSPISVLYRTTLTWTITLYNLLHSALRSQSENSVCEKMLVDVHFNVHLLASKCIQECP